MNFPSMFSCQESRESCHLTFTADHNVPLDDSSRKDTWEAISFLLITIMVSIANPKSNLVSNSSVTITLFFVE